MSKIPDSILSLFIEVGWYEGRSISINGKLPSGYGIYPPKYISFIKELIDLRIENKGTAIFEMFGSEESMEYNYNIIFCPMSGEGLNTMDDSGEELEYKYYSSIIGEQLYPIGTSNGDWHVAVDKNLTLYLFNMGYCCYRVHENPFEGLRCILENDLYSTTYELCEHEDDFGSWFKRPL